MERVSLFRPAQYVDAAHPRPRVHYTSGIADLDSLLGGVRAGELWLVVGAPRSGRSMLSVQLGAEAARQGVPVRYFLGIDSVHETMSRWRAHSLSRPLSECRGNQPDPGEPWVSWPAEFAVQPELQDGHPTALPDRGGHAVVVDDIDLWPGDPLEHVHTVRRWATHSGGTAVVSVPEHVASPSDAGVWQAWSRAVDVMLRIRHDATGSAFIDVVTNRRGPTATFEVDDVFELVSIRSLGDTRA